MQNSGPLREGDVPPWRKRTTVRAEKRRLLTWLADDDRNNKRDNNDIKLRDTQKAQIPAVVLIECFTPSNINELFASIDSWPIKPPEYLDSIKDRVKKWRNSDYGEAWTSVALFARPESGLFEYTADLTIPTPIKAVEFLLLSPLPSLTALVAIFYPTDSYGNIGDKLRTHYVPRIDRVNFRARGKIARFSHKLPFSRAKQVYYVANVIGPEHLQRENVDNFFSELEAHCWQWLRGRALGKVGVLPLDRRPSVRCIMLSGLEPFGPLERRSRIDDFSGWNAWYDSDSEEPYGQPRGPIAALGLNDPTSAWTTEKRDSFYFSVRDGYYDNSRAAYLSANRSSLVKALGDEFNDSDSGFNIFHYMLRSYTLGLLSAWTVEQTLARYKEEIAGIRDSSTASQSTYRVAKKLNEFLIRDGHDATIVARDAARLAELEYSFRETPLFLNLSEMNFQASLDRDRDGETTPPPRHRWRDYFRFWEPSDVGGEADSEEPAKEEPVFLVRHYRQEISASSRLVATELDLTTRSISTSATLLQAMSDVRLQWWSLGVSALAVIIAVLAIVLS